jgi:hypothetical protein
MGQITVNLLTKDLFILPLPNFGHNHTDSVTIIQNLLVPSDGHCPVERFVFPLRRHFWKSPFWAAVFPTTP